MIPARSILVSLSRGMLITYGLMTAQNPTRSIIAQKPSVAPYVR